MPTFSGWLFILLICAGASVLAVQHLHSFLAPNQPVGARLLIIEGWMAPGELDQAITRFRNGNYTRVITTGGEVPADLYRPDRPTYATLARDYLVRHGLPDQAVTAVPAPESAQDRTFLSAVTVREWLASSGHSVDAVDVFSSGVHSRRSRAVYRLAFGAQVRVGILAARPAGYDPETWWKSSAGAKAVISETLSWIWTELFFWPAARGSHEEKWGRTPTVLSAQ